MPVSWFFVPYKRRTGLPYPIRYCAMDDFTTQINADGGAWSECECLGDHAVVKVRASLTTLAAISAAPGFVRVPAALLTVTISSLPAAVQTAINTKLLALGYSQAEITAANLVTVGDLLRFALSRRLKPRYDEATDTIVLDGPVQPTRPLEHADGDVQ